jgi:pilus assembly protein CpaC
VRAIIGQQVGVLVFVLTLLVAGAPAAAQEHHLSFAGKGTVQQLTLAASTTATIALNVNYASLVVGNPALADAMPLTDHSFYILAKELGRTNVAVYDVNKELLGVIDVDIVRDLSALRAALRAAVPRAAITVTQYNGRIALSGHLPDAISLRTVMDITKQFADESQIVNAIRITDAQQVLLEVRFLEATRDAGRELGVGVVGVNSTGKGFATGGGTLIPPLGQNPQGPISNVGGLAPLISGATPFGAIVAHVLGGGLPIDVVVKALETKGLVRELAEPNLTAMSGETASFLAGGSIPYSTTQFSSTGASSGQGTQLVDYGIQLRFTPTVLDNGLIHLTLHPSVSEPDKSIVVNGQPALLKRDTETTIELHDGQSFAISGLLQSLNTKDIQQLPWVGQIPVIGALFRSAAYQKHESDLVVIITVHLVRPAVPGEVLHTPLDKTRPSNDVEQFLFGTMEVNKDQLSGFATCEGVKGPCGHIIDTANAKGVVLKK